MDETIRKTLANILSMTDTDSLPESFYIGVLERLNSFGYTLKDSDTFALCFAIKKVENHFNNSCNTSSIPEGLLCNAIDVVCGEFLLDKQKTGQLELNHLDLSGAIASISLGDASVSFDGDSTDEDKFNELLNHLLNKGEGDLICYRKMRW